MKKKLPTYTIQEIRQRLAHIESSRKTIYTYASISPKYSVYFFRVQEATLWRVVELGWCAIENFESNKISSAMILTRASMETSALLWHLNEKILRALNSNNIKRAKTLLKQVSTGVKAGDVVPEKLKTLPIHISDCIRSITKKYKGFSRFYDLISEYAHPNSLGNTQWYSRINYEESRIYFGLYVSESPEIKQAGIDCLGGAINAAVEAYNSIDVDVIQKLDEPTFK